MRIRLASWLHTATPIGGLLAVGASFLVPVIGWRGVFLLGVLPALLTVWLRRSVPEPRVWRMKSVRSAVGSVAPMFSGPQARTTWAAAGMMACIIFGLWSCTFWAPTLIISRLTAAGTPMAAAQRMASYSGLMLNGGTLLACGLMPWIAVALGPRRRAAAIFFIGSLVSVVSAYIVAAMWLDSVTLFIWLLPPLGFFTNGVPAPFTLWLPELFPTAQRPSRGGLAFSLGRVLGAVGPTLVGGLVVVTGSYPIAITAVSMIYLLGQSAIAMAPETVESCCLRKRAALSRLRDQRQRHRGRARRNGVDAIPFHQRQANASASGRLISISTNAIGSSAPFMTSCSMPAGKYAWPADNRRLGDGRTIVHLHDGIGEHHHHVRPAVGMLPGHRAGGKSQRVMRMSASSRCTVGTAGIVHLKGIAGSCHGVPLIHIRPAILRDLRVQAKAPFTFKPRPPERFILY